MENAPVEVLVDDRFVENGRNIRFQAAYPECEFCVLYFFCPVVHVGSVTQFHGCSAFQMRRHIYRNFQVLLSVLFYTLNGQRCKNQFLYHNIFIFNRLITIYKFNFLRVINPCFIHYSLNARQYCSQSSSKIISANFGSPPLPAKVRLTVTETVLLKNSTETFTLSVAEPSSF